MMEANTRFVNADLVENHPDHLFVNILVNKKESVDVHLKTSSPHNFIHPKLAQQLGLELFPTDKEVRSTAGHVTNYQWKCYLNFKSSTSICGGVKMENVECVVRKPSEPGHPCLLTFGHDFFRNFKYVLLVHYGELDRVYSYPYENNSMMNVMINKSWVEFTHLDSASSRSIMSMEFARRMNLRLWDSSQDIVSSTASPSHKQFCVVELRVLTDDNKFITHEKFKFVVVEKTRVDVVLGADFLAMHGSVKIQYGGRLSRLVVGRQPHQNYEMIKNLKIMELM